MNDVPTAVIIGVVFVISFMSFLVVAAVTRAQVRSECDACRRRRGV
jgi:hypothetical protein